MQWIKYHFEEVLNLFFKTYKPKFSDRVPDFLTEFKDQEIVCIKALCDRYFVDFDKFIKLAEKEITIDEAKIAELEEQNQKQTPPAPSEVESDDSHGEEEVYDEEEVEAPKKSKKGLIITIVLILLLGGGAAYYFLFMNAPADSVEEDDIMEADIEQADSLTEEEIETIEAALDGEGPIPDSMRVDSVDAPIDSAATDSSDVNMMDDSIPNDTMLTE